MWNNLFEDKELDEEVVQPFCDYSRDGLKLQLNQPLFLETHTTVKHFMVKRNVEMKS